MADYEISKIMWVSIVVALATSIFVIAKPQINTLANSTFGKISSITNGIGKSDNISPSNPNKINPNDAKWVEKGNYGTNGYFVRDKDGNGIVYALDPQQPVIAPEIVYAPDPQQPVFAPEKVTFTMGNQDLTSLRFLDKTILPKNSNFYFAYNFNLTTFDTKNLDTSNVTDMSGMFSNTQALTTLDVSKFDTSKVTNMSGMFFGMKALTALDVSKFDTSKVTNMGGMFGDMKALTALDVSNFNTSKVTNMGGMFGDMKALTALDVSNFDTSNVTNMSYMFGGLYALAPLDVSNFNTSNVTYVSGMFSDMNPRPDTSKFDTSKMTNVEEMFGIIPQ